MRRRECEFIKAPVKRSIVQCDRNNRNLSSEFTMESKVTSFRVETQPRITANEYFMGIAIISAKLSDKGRFPVGACIVNSDQTIVGTGYNTLHKACNKKKDDRSLYANHAEVAAILNKISRDVKGCTMYVTHPPCNNCANRIISSGIKEVIYCNMDRIYFYTTKRIQAAKQLFAANGVIYKECTTIYNKVVSKAYCGYSRLKKEEYFMAIAYLSSKRSEDVEKNISCSGACIVNKDNIIVGVGYNVCYADVIINSIQSTSCDVKDSAIYVTSFPCNESAKVIALSGIKTVIYLHRNIDEKTEAAKKIFDADNVKYIQSNVKISNIKIFKSEITLNTTTEVIEEIQAKEQKTMKDRKKKKRGKKNKKNKRTKSTNKFESKSTLNTAIEVIREKPTKEEQENTEGEEQKEENTQTKHTNKFESKITLNTATEVIREKPTKEEQKKTEEEKKEENTQTKSTNKTEDESNTTYLNTTVEVIKEKVIFFCFSLFVLYMVLRFMTFFKFLIIILIIFFCFT